MLNYVLVLVFLMFAIKQWNLLQLHDHKDFALHKYVLILVLQLSQRLTEFSCMQTPRTQQNLALIGKERVIV